jgi:phage tail sheath protein FI
VRDLAANPAAAQAIRPMPEALSDTLTSGRTQPARHPLASGTDGIASMTNNIYLGTDNVEPELRTGLFTLTTIPVLGIVALPGQTDQELQQALIDHCEVNRYRFAVLDGERDGMLADVLAQRQHYSSSYAALYTPWVTVPHPFPPNLNRIEPFPLPPSGPMMGLFARVDNDRGVHKAPANEPLRGITGLVRYLNQGEQDILNPSYINAIRRFDNRGIRAFGARTMADDPSWKYISVRRLLLFIEQSIDLGLQWAVHEPNAEPLWADARQSITRFLNSVWRSGALEGIRSEQAFFVKCDRTTMTQDDIDNGRLITVIGVAPVKPAEFVIIRISQKSADS